MNKFLDFTETLDAFKENFACHLTLHPYTMEVDGLIEIIPNLHNNPYCSYIKEKAKQTNRCRYFDDIFPRQTITANSGKPFFKFCHGRVLELLVPLHANGHLAGLLYIGPFRWSLEETELPPDTLVSNFFCKGTAAIQRKHPLPVMSAAGAKRLLKLTELLIFRLQSLINQPLLPGPAIDSPKDMIDSFLNASFKNRNCSLSRLAAYLNLSDSRTTQILRREFSRSFPELLNHKRIDYATSLLSRTYFNASQISSFAGFNSPAYFFRVFKKYTGMNPNEYRRISSHQK